ncbi:hypothetical protein MMC14_008351 [Varicellaria rhodocarpa]|nr:hypothetical protein [Varicellaria rhodocarpa]
MPQSVRPTSVTKIYNVFSTPSTLACLLIFFLKRAGFQSEPMIYQYVSERFAWKLQETAWFRSAISTSSVIVVGLILPFGRAYLQGDKIQNQRIDRGVIQGSSMLLVVAFFGIWLAPRPTLVTSAVVLVGLGEGLEPALQSLSASLISGTQNAQLFTAIAFMETFARIVAATVMARLYSIGQNIEAKPNGLPFLVSAVSQPRRHLVAFYYN